MVAQKKSLGSGVLISGQGSQQVQLLVMLGIGAMLGVLRVPFGAGLAWPGWDCRCRQEGQDQGMVTEWTCPVGMIGRCTCWFGWGCR